MLKQIRCNDSNMFMSKQNQKLVLMPLYQIPENDDQQTQAEMENCGTLHAEVTEVREVVAKPTVSSRRGSQSEASREPNQPLTSER